MLRKVLSGIVSACLLTAGSVAAQEPAPPQARVQLPPLDRPPTYDGPPLSLAQAMDAALDMNPNLIALQREWDVMRLRPEQAEFLSAPTFAAQIWQWPIDTINPLNTNMYMFTVQQELPSRGKRDLRTAVAQKDAEIAGNEVTVHARQTLTDLKHAYASLLVSRTAANLYGQSAAVLRQLADASESKYAAGRISQQDVLKPVVELSKLYDDALTFRQQADMAAAQLNVLMGRAVDAPIGPLQDATPRSSPPDLETLVTLAVDHQPALAATRLAIDRAKADLAVAKNETRPDYTVQGGYMLMPHGTDAWTGQVGISWPSAPWSRGKIAARVAEATAEVTAAEARQQAIESHLRLTIYQAHVRVTTALQRMALLETAIMPQSRQSLDASRVAYETDRVDFLTVLESQRTLLNEQLDYARALADYADARADLEHAVGVDFER